MLVVVGDFTNAIYDIRSSAAGKPPLANSAPAQLRAEAGKTRCKIALPRKFEQRSNNDLCIRIYNVTKSQQFQDFCKVF